MRLKVLLVDDEPLARLRLATLLGDVDEPASEVVGEAGDAAAAAALDGEGSALAAVNRRSTDAWLPDSKTARHFRAKASSPTLSFGFR